MNMVARPLQRSEVLGTSIRLSLLLLLSILFIYEMIVLIIIWRRLEDLWCWIFASLSLV